MAKSLGDGKAKQAPQEASPAVALAFRLAWAERSRRKPVEDWERADASHELRVLPVTVNDDKPKVELQDDVLMFVCLL